MSIHGQRDTENAYLDQYRGAVDQLGHSNSDVRLAGVYALANLADAWPARRQRCVDVLCAHLRTPWLTPELEDTDASYVRGVSQRQQTGSTDGLVTTATDLRGESEVRATILRVIGTHLQKDDARPMGYASWSSCTLDLSGAHLPAFNWTGCTIGQLSAQKASFVGDAWFTGASFAGDAWFTGASFEEDAWFTGASFAGDAHFDGATLYGDAWFTGASFAGAARFTSGLVAGGAVWFVGASFAGDAHFDGATLNGDAWFNEATFNGDGWFKEATFFGDALFDGATFNGDAWFKWAVFAWAAGFQGATFNGNASFESATMPGPGWSSRVLTAEENVPRPSVITTNRQRGA